MKEFEFVLVVIGILGDTDSVNLVILPTDQAHGSLDLERAFQTKGYALLLAEYLQIVAVNAGVFGTDEHVLGFGAGGFSPGNELLKSGFVVGQMLCV